MTRAGSVGQLPVTVHYVLLVVGAIALLWLGRHQSFFYDDWSFLNPFGLGDVNAPHVGHWSLTPQLVFFAFRNLFGVGSYVPFYCLALVAHLATVHLTWRIMRRAGVNPWIATALATLLLFLGAGAENILWAFQLGFMGAIAVGLGVVLLVDLPKVTVRRGVLIIVLSVWAVTFSGTALPVVIVAGVISLIRHGIKKTVILFGPVLIVFAAWFLVWGRFGQDNSGRTVGSPATIVKAVMEYIGHMFADGLSLLTPIPAAGVVIVLVIAAWCIRGIPRFSGIALPAYLGVAAALIFAVLTAYSRAGLGIANASSSRYVYVIVTLLIPAMGVILTQLSPKRWATVVAAVAVITIAIGYNSATLITTSATQTALEQASKARIAAALDLALHTPKGELPEKLVPAPEAAPTLNIGQILELNRIGQLPQSPYTLKDKLDVLPYLWITKDSAPGAGCVTTTRPTTIPAHSTGIRVYVPTEMTVGVTVTEDGTTGDAHNVSEAAGVLTFDNSGDLPAVVTGQLPGLALCE